MKRKPPLSINIELRKLQRISALLVAIQYATNEEVDFDVADALAVVVTLLGESLVSLDRLEVKP